MTLTYVNEGVVMGSAPHGWTTWIEVVQCSQGFSDWFRKYPRTMFECFVCATVGR